MTIDLSYVEKLPLFFKIKGMSVAKKTGPEQYMSIGPQCGMCKANLWDYLFINFNKKEWNILIPPEHLLSNTDKTVVLLFNQTAENIPDIKKRLLILEKAFNFKRSIINYDEKERIIVVEGSKRWLANVEMFSLFLSAIRYSNHADKESYDFTVANLSKINDWYINNVKGKTDWPVDKIPNSHMLGFYNTFSKDINAWKDIK